MCPLPIAWNWILWPQPVPRSQEDAVFVLSTQECPEKVITSKRDTIKGQLAVFANTPKLDMWCQVLCLYCKSKDKNIKALSCQCLHNVFYILLVLPWFFLNSEISSLQPYAKQERWQTAPTEEACRRRHLHASSLALSQEVHVLKVDIRL